MKAATRKMASVAFAGVAAASATVAAVPAKGKMPSMEGVPGELICLDGLVLEFARGQRKKSPYDDLLDALAKAGENQVLRFGDVRARTSVSSRAKKKDLSVMFAEHEGQLYVKLVGRVGDDLREVRRLKIHTLLRKSPLATMRIAVALREGGDVTVDGQVVGAIMGQMLKAGEVIQREGGDWAVSPTYRPAAK